MSKYMASVFPRQNWLWRILGVAVLLLTMLVPGPLVANADGRPDNGHANGRAPVHVVANLLITSGGTVKSLNRDKTKFQTNGEKIVGCVSSSNWEAIKADSGCSSLPYLGSPLPSLLVDHNSIDKVKGNRIFGKGRGEFSLGSFEGRYEAKIEALWNESYGTDPATGFPRLITHIDDRGKWTVHDKKGNTAEGTFEITIDFMGLSPAGMPILSGRAVFDGTHNHKGHDD